MSTQTTPSFDIAALCRALESWDVDALIEFYSDDAEFREIDRGTPPSAPRILRGRDEIEAMFRDVASSGIETRIADSFAAGDRLAMAVRCRYPTGEYVQDHVLAQLRDGKIVRHVGVQAWDE
jgi:ketosteroid isomerase-like protein